MHPRARLARCAAALAVAASLLMPLPAAAQRTNSPAAAPVGVAEAVSWSGAGGGPGAVTQRDGGDSPVGGRSVSLGGFGHDDRPLSRVRGVGGGGGGSGTAKSFTAISARALVSNQNQTAGTPYTLSTTQHRRVATAFQTGSNPAGYVLDSVLLGVSAGADAEVEVEIRDDGSSKAGTTLIGTLSGSPDDDTSTFDEFTSTEGVLLEPDTWYWVALKRNNATNTATSYAVSVATANTNGTDTLTPTAGFDIGNGRSEYDGSSWSTQSSSDHELKFTLRGLSGFLCIGRDLRVRSRGLWAGKDHVCD